MAKNKRFTSVEIVKTEEEATKPSSAYFIPKDNEKVKMIITDDNGEKRELDGTGDDGVSATIEVGNVTTLPPTSNASVENIGTNRDAIFNFSIPKGEKGEDGDISVLNFEVDNDMHLIMELETNTNLDFTLDGNGHLILTN